MHVYQRLIKFIEAWWLRVCVIIEVKRKDDPDIVSRVTQLMTYVRQVLREQLDRWFVPGLLLTGTQLAVWVVDRSGALGTQKSFNFHKVHIILDCRIQRLTTPLRNQESLSKSYWHVRRLNQLGSAGIPV